MKEIAFNACNQPSTSALAGPRVVCTDKTSLMVIRMSGVEEGLCWTHSGLTCCHLASPALTWINLNSLGLTWTHLHLVGLTWYH